MAKCVITIIDNKDKKSVKINAVFSPAINMKDDSKNTNAHSVGVKILQYVKKEGNKL